MGKISRLISKMLKGATKSEKHFQTIGGESDLVFAIATPSAQSLANTTKTTPVVFSAVTDPLAAKLVKKLERTWWQYHRDK